VRFQPACRALPLALLLVAVTYAASSSSAPVVRPQLTDNNPTLILLDEIREPPEQRQPSVRLTRSPSTGTREIRVSGRGIVAPTSIDLSCSGRVRRVTLTAVQDEPDQKVATYHVSADAADTILGYPGCFLVLVGVRIPLPQDLVQVVWGDSKPSSSAGPRPSTWQVVRVVDGDTIEVDLGGRTERVRYIGIILTRRRPTIRRSANNPGGSSRRR
jgi:hypothetical protein